MRHFAALGFERYRFLAGEARYKTSLADGHDDLLWLKARRPTLIGRLTHGLRRAKSHFADSQRAPTMSGTK
jgi:hypothetical protein